MFHFIHFISAFFIRALILRGNIAHRPNLHQQDVSSDNLSEIDSSESEIEDEEEVSFDYPQNSCVRDRLELEKENARKAASKVANHFNKKKKKKGKSPKQINRRTPKHKDMVILADDVVNSIKESKSDVRGLTSIVMASLQAQQAGSARATNTQATPNSPATKRAKTSSEIKGYIDIVSRLRAERRLMIENKEPQDEIDAMTKSIKEYDNLRVNLESQLFKM